MLLQIISTIIFYVWMFLMLYLLWKIWRNSLTTAAAWHTLMDVVIKTAEAAQEAAKAAALLAREKPPL